MMAMHRVFVNVALSAPRQTEKMTALNFMNEVAIALVQGVSGVTDSFMVQCAGLQEKKVEPY